MFIFPILRMQDYIAEKSNLMNYWKNNNIITNDTLLESFLKVKREHFILEEHDDYAYTDAPLPILEGQTISQPTTVMIMIQALELKKEDVVLEIGAGSGYNAAIMSHLCKHVYTTDIVPELVEFAEQNLRKEGIINVTVLWDDGSLDYGLDSPFDKIIVTCACPRIPGILLEQLKVEGKLVIPVGPMHLQEMLVIKKENDNLAIKNLGNFMFVPIQGEYGY